MGRAAGGERKGQERFVVCGWIPGIVSTRSLSFDGWRTNVSAACGNQQRDRHRGGRRQREGGGCRIYRLFLRAHDEQCTVGHLPVDGWRRELESDFLLPYRHLRCSTHHG